MVRLTAKILSIIRAPGSVWLLTVLLVLSQLLYLRLIRFEAVSTTSSVVTFVALLCVLFLLYAAAYISLAASMPSRTALVVVLLGTVLFRVTLLFAGLPAHSTWEHSRLRLQADIQGRAVTYDSFLMFDNDIWRYLWDGHVSSAGINPYVFEPRNSALDGLAHINGDNTVWADIRANVNHNDVPTIYPPFAETIFRAAHAVAPGSVFVMKSLLVGSDLLTVLLMLLVLHGMGRPLTDVVLYGWNPLVVKVVAGSGHIDAVLGTLLMVMVWALLRKRTSLAAMAWALAILTKLAPILLLPFVGRRIGWRRTALSLGIVFGGYLGYLDTKGSPFVGLFTFGREWQFNSGFFRLMESLLVQFSPNPMPIVRTLAAASIVAVVVWLMYRDATEALPFHSLAVIALGASYVVSPTVMPWYIVPILPLAVVARAHLWLRLSPLLCLAFFVMINGTEPVWLFLLEWGGVTAIVLRECLRWKRQPFSITAQENFEGVSQ